MIPKRLALLVVIALAAVVPLSACATSQQIEVGTETVIIDVRTPVEYSAGHLDGAINIDISSSQFDSQIAELPQDGSYLVYCASGNRSASAAARMGDLGYADVIDAGGLSSAADSTGIPVVTG